MENPAISNPPGLSCPTRSHRPALGDAEKQRRVLFRSEQPEIDEANAQSPRIADANLVRPADVRHPEQQNARRSEELHASDVDEADVGADQSVVRRSVDVVDHRPSRCTREKNELLLTFSLSARIATVRCRMASASGSDGESSQQRRTLVRSSARANRSASRPPSCNTPRATPEAPARISAERSCRSCCAPARSASASAGDPRRDLSHPFLQLAFCSCRTESPAVAAAAGNTTGADDKGGGCSCAAAILAARQGETSKRERDRYESAHRRAPGRMSSVCGTPIMRPPARDVKTKRDYFFLTLSDGPPIGLHQLSDVHVGVTLGRAQARMPEEFLYGTQVGARFEQMGRKRVAERVRADSVPGAAGGHVTPDQFVDAARGQPPSAVVQEQRVASPPTPEHSGV